MELPKWKWKEGDPGRWLLVSPGGHYKAEVKTDPDGHLPWVTWILGEKTWFAARDTAMDACEAKVKADLNPDPTGAERPTPPERWRWESAPTDKATRAAWTLTSTTTSVVTAVVVQHWSGDYHVRLPNYATGLAEGHYVAQSGEQASERLRRHFGDDVPDLPDPAPPSPKWRWGRLAGLDVLMEDGRDVVQVTPSRKYPYLLSVTWGGEGPYYVRREELRGLLHGLLREPVPDLPE